jgi:hypothetical protein
VLHLLIEPTVDRYCGKHKNDAYIRRFVSIEKRMYEKITSCGVKRLGFPIRLAGHCFHSYD